VEAWKLRALEGRGIGGIRIELRRLGVRVGKIRIRRAIEEVAGAIQKELHYE